MTTEAPDFSEEGLNALESEVGDLIAVLGPNAGIPGAESSEERIESIMRRARLEARIDREAEKAREDGP